MTPTLDSQQVNISWDLIKNYCEDWITVKDLEFRYISCNNAFLNLFNLKDENKVIGKTAYDILPSLNAIEIENAQKELLEQGYGSKQLLLTVNKENYPETIIKLTTSLMLENNKPIGFLTLTRDVTNEERLKKKLVNANTNFNILLKHIPMVIYMKDYEGNYITTSEYGKSFVKKGIDPYINEKVTLDKTPAEIQETDNWVINTNQYLIDEKTGTDTKGIRHWYRVIKAPINNINDNMKGVITIVENIDAEKQNAEQQELFLAELTHDMKNPILAQISSMELLLRGTLGELNEKQKDMLKITVESAKYMKELLYSILKSYKYDNGALKLQYSCFDIHSLVQECMNEAYALANDKNIKLIYNTELNDVDSEMFADKKHLRIVISNMINNGLSYGFKDTDYTITTKYVGENIVFNFENMSPEIPEDIKNSIFDKYVTGASRYKKIGFGLGLYISKKIVDKHNGLIYITTEGNRNTFTVEIPKNPAV